MKTTAHDRTSSPAPLPDETTRARRASGPPTRSVCTSAGWVEVPSYYALPGASIDTAARSLGLRVLGRWEDGPRLAGEVVAEIHDRDVAGSHYCVRI